MDGRQITARTIINAAGLFSDRVARMVGDESFNIIPRRGEYIMFDKNTLNLQKILFPTPTVLSKGIVVAPTRHDNFFVGPNAHEVDSVDAINTSSQGLNEILEGGQKIVDELPLRKHITNFAGIRASTLKHDFIIKQSDSVPHLILAAGIDSPGLSSCLAIAERIEVILKEECHYELVENLNYTRTRTSQTRLADLTDPELAQKIHKNPQWGNIICRCEFVSEAEIVKACHLPIPCTNTDMIKRRLRPSMGRCQGGFCLPKVMKIISRERDMIFEQVTKTGGQSDIVFKRTKNLSSEIYQGKIL
jgi:glycerol-3-phosphate dehydrogenase